MVPELALAQDSTTILKKYNEQIQQDKNNEDMLKFHLQDLLGSYMAKSKLQDINNVQASSSNLQRTLMKIYMIDDGWKVTEGNNYIYREGNNEINFHGEIA